MFNYDTEALESDILVHDGAPKLTYHEYAAFTRQRIEQFQPTLSGSSPGEVSQSVLSEDWEGRPLFDQSVRQGHAVDRDGEFRPQGDHVHPALRGRVRQVICRRRVNFGSDEKGSLDGLNLTRADYHALKLHPSTIQYVRRTTTESTFWDQRHETLSIILCFSTDPRPPYDFLSFTYNIPDRTATMLLRQSYDPHIHDVDELEQYGERMQACKPHWAHPLVTPVVLLQIQFLLSERAVAENEKDIAKVEHDVERMAGFETMDSRPKSRSSSASSGQGSGFVHPKRPTELMKNAHDAFKKSIQLLDTITWMDRAIGVLLHAGDELEEVRYESENDVELSADLQGALISSSGRTVTGLARARIIEDPMSAHWHEIRQFLESLQQLCKSLETERHMLEVRCKSQIDIIYAKMQQEDNILTARMAVTSTRDSSSLKALAVITALFLPGDFIASLLGMAMFEKWNDEKFDGEMLPKTPERFWLYWALALPLTLIIFVLWRLWWVSQDRFFRQHLSKELSEERYWTEDRRPRKLDHGFMRDFFTLSARRDEKAEIPPPPELPYSLTSRTGRTLSGSQAASLTGSTKSPSPPAAAFRLKKIAFAGTDTRKSGRNTFRGHSVV
ncbi:hypothetical protein QBC40DRAFT_222116 [Triangularia verruculosa]|uniref:Uncharacterized protein n=1 Tax=Triangularia verruculosa TaxID=2587418 RepID=A0AAN6XJZ7_9PEZI|nr:hypothetical protein QBC40DRAFT_222116 [Triangularia verruculosa]